MGLIENIKIALSGLKLNKMRAFLTMLGIIIGTSSVIGIWTIGRALSNSVSEGFDSVGNTAINVSLIPREGHTWEELSEKDNLSKLAIDKMQEKFSNNIDSIALSSRGASGKVSLGKKSVNVNIEPTSPGAKSANNLTMITGRFLEDSDINEVKEVAVISDKVVEKRFDSDPSKALGSDVEIDSGSSLRIYKVVGVYKYEPMSFGIFGGDSEDAPTSVYIPVSVGNMQFGDGNSEEKYEYFLVNAASRETLSETAKEIENFFNENYYKDNFVAKVQAQTIESAISQVNSVMSTIKLGIGAIAAISLLVGGIGVMNILLVSVTERTREIGIRKALGATNKDIRSQFIIESVIICIIGGIFGILLGGAIGFGGSTLMKSPTLPSVSSIIVAVGFSMVIGVFFGYYPANKAAKLNPIDALRYE
ncbi:MAG: ABC transporter permease [Peptoniphilaceae bacterium]